MFHAEEPHGLRSSRHDALGDLKFGGQRQSASVPTGADDQFLRGNLPDGYNDMCSGAGSAATLDRTHMMNGFCFLQIAGVLYHCPGKKPIILWELCIL